MKTPESANCSDAYGFGCLKGINGQVGVGHELFRPSYSRARDDEELAAAGCPFRIYRKEHGLDSGYCIKVKRRGGYQEFPNGICKLHQEDGWSMISFWDNSGDTRGASNMNFMLKGTFSYEEALAKSREIFPALFKRFEVAGIVFSIAEGTV